MKILIVDDQELVLLSLEKCLIDLGYEVISASNVSAGIGMYDLNTPDLVIADINMPFSDEAILDINNKNIEHGSGLELAKHIKKIKGQ